MSEEQQQDWRSALPEKLREAPFLKNPDKSVDQIYADLEDAAGYMGNSLRIPGPDATDEDVAKFRERAAEKIPGLMAVPDPDSDDYTDVLRKIGLPEAADKYKVPEDCPFEGEELANLMAKAHKDGLTQKQFSSQLGDLIAQVKDAREKAELRDTEQRALLQSEWGEAYEDRVAAVDKFLEGAPEALRGLPRDAETMRWLYDMADSFNEGTETTRQADGGSPKLTPGECREQAQEILVRLKGMRKADNPQLYDSLMHKRIDLLRRAG